MARPAFFRSLLVVYGGWMPQKNASRTRGLLIASVASVASIIWLGCQSIQVTADFRRNFRFSSVDTYAWLPDPPGHTGDPLLHNPLVDARVRDAMNRELQEMGYRRVAVDEADVHVTYYLGLDTRVSWRMVSHSYLYNGGFADRHTTQTALREYERGTLLIDVLDPLRRELVWRGTARARVRPDSDPERREEKIKSAVAKTLAQFPPAGPHFRPGEAARGGGESS